MGYYDPKFIYDKTGYWDNEYYRLGIVYLLPSGELSPVFNIRGGLNIGTKDEWSKIDLYTKDGDRHYISYNEDSNYIVGDDLTVLGNISNENTKGIIRLKAEKDTNIIHGIRIIVKPEVI